MDQIYKIENGLKIAAENMPYMESVALGIWINAGGRYEYKDNSGISHLLEHLLFKGTMKRDMVTIKQEIEGRGGTFNGFTSEEHTCYLVKILPRHAELGLDILSDMVLNPRLSEEEMTKEKSVIIEEINMYKDMPSHYVHEVLAEMMWPDQPLGMPLAGTVESVSSITRDALVAYKEEFYDPVNMLVIGAGRITEDDMVNMSKKYISKTARKGASRFVAADSRQEKGRLVIKSKDTEQTHLAMGLHAPDRSHPDRYALSLLNIILGANMSSRLFHLVRDEMALCYEISSSARKYSDAGAFIISAGLDDKNLVKALEVILKQLFLMGESPVGKEELGRAKEYYRGQLLFALEDTMSRMLWLGEKIVSGDKELSVEGILSHIDAVKADDIMRVSRDVFRYENLNLAIIGPIKNDKSIMEVLHLK